MPRPKIPIDPAELEALSGLQCTQEEAAAVLRIDPSTLCKRMKTDKVLADAWEAGRNRGKASLRRKQYDAAMNGDRTMLVWLGKQWLSQTDKVEQDIGAKDGTHIAWVAEWGGRTQTAEEKAEAAEATED